MVQAQVTDGIFSFRNARCFYEIVIGQEDDHLRRKSENIYVNYKPL